jgi:phospholipase/lecithinase/hemolysin
MFKKILYSILILIGLFVVLVLAINLWPTHNYPAGHKFENLIVFGDSLSDSSPMGYSKNQSGNNYWVMPQGIPKPAGAPITSEISPEDTHRYTWQNYLIQH